MKTAILCFQSYLFLLANKTILTHSCIVFQKWNTTFLFHYDVQVMWNNLFLGPKPLYRLRTFILWYHLGCPKVTPPSKVAAPTSNKQCETRRNKRLLSLNCVYLILLFCIHIIRFQCIFLYRISYKMDTTYFLRFMPG